MTRRNRLDIYEDHGAGWWDPDSPTFRSLQTTTVFRVEQLCRWLGEDWSGRTAVDLGCGGGLLAEPLARRGARVVGFDLSRRSLQTARAHGDDLCRSLGYAAADLRCVPLGDGCADVVLLADVLEHLDDPPAALAEAARLSRPGGRIYVNTLSRTLRASLLAVHLAEGVGLVPRGTHDPRLFIEPARLRRWAEAAGLEWVTAQGEAPRIWPTLRTWRIHLRPSRSLAVAYSALLARPGR